MKQPVVIAICGFKRSGKDTIADYLVKQYGYNKIKIADPLKETCSMLFGLSQEQIEGDQKEVIDQRWGVTPRQIMQYVGTELMQYQIQELLPNIGRTFWIKSLLGKHSANSACPLVVSDMRFQHELDEMRAHYGDNVKVIKVVNCRVDRDGDAHISEKEWITIKEDVLIVNDQGLDQLHTAIDAYMAKFNQN
jgi:hypothetical protein